MLLTTQNELSYDEMAIAYEQQDYNFEEEVEASRKKELHQQQSSLQKKGIEKAAWPTKALSTVAYGAWLHSASFNSHLGLVRLKPWELYKKEILEKGGFLNVFDDPIQCFQRSVVQQRNNANQRPAVEEELKEGEEVIDTRVNQFDLANQEQEVQDFSTLNRVVELKATLAEQGLEHRLSYFSFKSLGEEEFFIDQTKKALISMKICDSAWTEIPFSLGSLQKGDIHIKDSKARGPTNCQYEIVAHIEYLPFP